MTGRDAHIGYSSAQESGKLLLFIFCEILNQPGFNAQYGLLHVLKTLPAFWLNEDPLAASVFGIRTQLNKILLFQSGKKSGNSRVA